MKQILQSLITSLLVTIISFYSEAQQQVQIDKVNVKKDSLSTILKNKGKFEGQVRTFFMSTTNQGALPDYYAMAIGGGIGYYSPILKGFQVGLSGFVVYDVASSSLVATSPFSNRYEIGLFDITNPSNQEVLNRIENLYLRYHFNQKNKSFMQVGKFLLKSPLINPQDGRMRPNMQEGIWSEWNDSKKIKIKGGWLWRTSPRSTMKWYDIGQSLVYPNGRAVNGSKANYSPYIKSHGIGVFNVTWKPVSSLEYQAWNYYVDNLFNTTLNKVEYKHKSTTVTWMAGAQYLWQHSLYNDTLSVDKQYITRNEQSHTISGRVGFINSKGNEWYVNYTRITRHGRYLFPREWGIEPFYTFMQRERNEGAGDVHAANIQHTRYLDHEKNWEVMTQGGIYWMPSVNNSRLNKYALPSYYQVNVRSRYRFQGFLNGLNLEVLYTFKGNLNTQYGIVPPTFHNKVNMHNLSIVMDYNF